MKYHHARKLFVQVTYDERDAADTNVIHQFVDDTWKRKMALPLDDVLMTSEIEQFEATESLFFVNATQVKKTEKTIGSRIRWLTKKKDRVDEFSGWVLVYKWSDSSSKIHERLWQIEIDPFSSFSLSASGILMSRMDQEWQLREVKDSFSRCTIIETTWKRPVYILSDELVLARCQNEYDEKSFTLMKVV